MAEYDIKKIKEYISYFIIVFITLLVIPAISSAKFFNRTQHDSYLNSFFTNYNLRSITLTDDINYGEIKYNDYVPLKNKSYNKPVKNKSNYKIVKKHKHKYIKKKHRFKNKRK